MVSHDCVAFYLLTEEVSRDVKVVQTGQGADEILGGYDWYPPLAAVAAPMRWRPTPMSSSTGGSARWASCWPSPGWPARRRPRVHRRPVRPARGGDRRRCGTAQRHHHHVGGRPGETGRQHDDGLGTGGAGSLPRPRGGRAGGRIPPELKLADGGKGVLKAASRGVVPDEVIDRTKGYFPVPAIRQLEGPFLRAGS